MVVASGGVAARQGNQVGFASIIQLPVPVGLRMVVQHALQTLVVVPPFGAKHCALRRVQRRRHLGSAPTLIGLEQDPGPIDDPSRVLAATDQSLQLAVIFRRQMYRKFS